MGHLSEQLQQLRAQEPAYSPEQSIQDALGEKTLLLFVGPSSVGKSSLMNAIAATDATFSRVGSFTSRQPRADDEPDLYDYLESNEEIESTIAAIQQKKVVQYAVHPTTGALYGSYSDHYPAQYNMLDTLYSAVPGLERLPVKDVVVLGIVAEATLWRQWFMRRFSHDQEAYSRRLQEAEQSLDWLRRREDVVWIQNTPNQLPDTARRVITAVTTHAKPPKQEQTIQKADELQTLIQIMMKGQ